MSHHVVGSWVRREEVEAGTELTTTINVGEPRSGLFVLDGDLLARILREAGYEQQDAPTHAEGS